MNDLKDVNKFFDNKYIVFIALKNAYDQVIHDKLYIKLSNYGINEEIININDGLLQGSLICPNLFTIYINDLIIDNFIIDGKKEKNINNKYKFF